MKWTSFSSILREIVTMTVQGHDKPVEMSCKQVIRSKWRQVTKLILENSRIVVARRWIIELQVGVRWILYTRSVACLVTSHIGLRRSPCPPNNCVSPSEPRDFLAHCFIVSRRFCLDDITSTSNCFRSNAKCSANRLNISVKFLKIPQVA